MSGANTFADLGTLQRVLSRLCYSGNSAAVSINVNMFLKDASEFFTELNYLAGPAYFLSCLQNVMSNFDIHALTVNKSIDMNKVYNSFSGIVACAIHVSSADDKIISSLWRNKHKLKISKLIAQLKDPEHITKIVRNYITLHRNDLSIYRPALVSSYVTPQFRIKLADEIIIQTLDSYHSKQKIFPYIEDVIAVHNTHTKFLSKHMPHYTYSVLSLFANLEEYKDQLTKSKYKQFVKALTGIGFVKYGERFKPALKVATSLSIMANTDYWRSLDISIIDTNEILQIDYC